MIIGIEFGPAMDTTICTDHIGNPIVKGFELGVSEHGPPDRMFALETIGARRGWPANIR